MITFKRPLGRVNCCDLVRHFIDEIVILIEKTDRSQLQEMLYSECLFEIST